MNIRQSVRFLAYRVMAEIKSDLNRSYLGVFWWFLEPCLYIGAFYMLFGLGIRRGGEDFFLFLVCGLVPWKWFASVVSGSSNVILANRSLILQVYLPKYLLPLIVLSTNTLKFLVMGLVALPLILLSSDGSIDVMGLVGIFLLNLYFNLAVGLLVAAIVPFARDLQFVINNGLILLMFLSGIFYSLGELSTAIADVLAYNPLVYIVQGYRMALLGNVEVSSASFAYVAICASVFAVVGFGLLHRFDRYYVKNLD